MSSAAELASTVFSKSVEQIWMANHDNTVALNNYLQATGRDNALVWGDVFSGPRHNVTWTSRCMINDEVLGTGTGATKTAAHNVAAGVALAALKARDEAAATAE